MSVSRSGLVTPFCPLSLNWALLLLGISDLDSGGNYCLALLDEEISERRKGQPSRYTIYLDEDTGPTARSQGVASCRWLITNVTKIVIFMSYYVPWRWYRSWNTSTEGEADITLEDLQKGPVFLSFAYRGTCFRPAVPGGFRSKRLWTSLSLLWLW